MIEKMTKYSFILLSGDKESFLQDVQGLGLLDITRSEKAVDAFSADALARLDSIRRCIDFLGRYKCEDEDVAKAVPLPVNDPVADTAALRSRIEALDGRIADTGKELRKRTPWGEFDKEKLGTLEEAGCKLRFYEVSKKVYDPAWEQLQPLLVISSDKEKVRFVTVSDDPGYTFPVAPCTPPEAPYTECEAEIAGFREESAVCKATILKAKEYIPSLEEEYRKLLTDLDRYLASAHSDSAAEGSVTVFTGFAPTCEDERLAKELEGMPVYYLTAPAVKEDNPPIKLRNNAFTRQFAVLTDMYGRPVYDEFDPTPYLSVFFLLFFAMCMGDAGYGLILIILGCLMRKSEGMKGLAPLVTILGAGTFLIGIVMHTFFGFDISQAAWVPDFLKKIMVTGMIAGFEAQMVIALGIGVVHLSLAMVVKTIYATRNKGFLESLSVWGWTLLIVGGVIVGAIALAGLLPAPVLKWIVIALGVLSALGIFFFNDIHRSPLKNIGSGLWETYNTVTGLLGDVLSYLRLYALGLAGGMLGKAFNDIAAMTLGDGGFGIGWLFFPVIFLVGHTLNLAMCCLGAFVHPLRLNFLEFFKNSGYEGKGRNYKPLTNESSVK